MKDDTISRAAAVDALDRLEYTPGEWAASGLTMCKDAIKALPSAQPEQRNARVFQGIIVEYPSISAYPEYEGKPYFSIKYTENGQGFIGYGTYKPEVLSEYLKEYFMPLAQPGWIPCSERLPQNGYWLWSANGGEVKKDFYWDGHWELAEKYGYEVLAWMPLPTPYREGGQDG